MSSSNKPNSQTSSSLVQISQVKPEKPEWIWEPYLPFGKVTGFEGDPGIGKSFVALAIAAAESLGKGLPSVPETNPANVLICSAEDGLADTIRPRLDAMGANVDNIHAIKGHLSFDDNGLKVLESYIQVIDPELIIIDPLVAYLGSGVDIYRANEIRAVMAQLADLAEKHRTAILVIRHLTKGYQSKAIYRGQGNIDITAACRSVLLAGCNPQNHNERAFFHIKSNLAPMGPAMGYEINDGVFKWTGESKLTVSDILASEAIESSSVIEDAVSFLQDVLADGPVEVTQILNEAKQLCLSEKSVRRAKLRLDIVAKREGETGVRGGGVWLWELPDKSVDQAGD